MAKYVFPAIIEKADDGYNVSFPDIENCFTCGKTFAEAIEMAQDVLPLMLCQM
ncbi:MAG TPA: HicB family protein, partial [Lachnospiraceae bacterium]|nr:HicB family protein [Lachnospiraceae bacterium]